MKTLIITTSIVLTAFITNAQTSKLAITNYYKVYITDSSKRIAYMDGKDSIVVTDSLKTIRQLFKMVDSQSNELSLVIKQKEYLLKAISYINTNGIITDKTKYKKAFAKYLSLKSKPN